MNENPFSIIGPKGPQSSKAITEVMGATTDEKIKNIIHSGRIVLFMKGSADMPQCGFSANTCAILDSLGAEYNTFDILQNPEIRQGVKEYSNWLTFPQLYIEGELVGGNDIVTQMYHQGELQKLIKD